MKKKIEHIRGMKKKERLIRAIPGMIVGIGMTSLIIWGVTKDKKCDRMLKSGNAIVQVAYVYNSNRKISGGNFETVTEYRTKDGSISFTTTALKKPVPQGLPIYVKYMPECSNCYEFLWDSIIPTDSYNVKYTRNGYEKREFVLLNH